MAALEALERNEVNHLPGGIFTRAFVRAYALEVGLDPEQTVQDFLAHFPIEGVADGSPYANDSREHDQFQSQQRMATTVVRLLLLSVPVAGLLIFFGVRGEPNEPRDDGSVDAESTSPVPPPAVIEPTVQNQATAEPVAPSGEAKMALQIDIHPTGACWVSLMLDGEQVFSRVMQAGERVVREARREIVLSIGDAGAFQFTLNQQPGRPLGASGEVITARINHENYQAFLTQ
jgi:cytoskeletal protein RodZ